MTQRTVMPGDNACTYAQQLQTIVNNSSLPTDQKQIVLQALDIVISHYCP